jgi:hypothetical protein
MVSIAVVIATQNRAKWLERQLAALVPQLGPGDRIIVIRDGGEKYKTGKHMYTADDRVELIELTKSVGVDRARRMANALVNDGTSVILEIDDHDIAKPGLLRAIRQTFEERTAMIAFCDVDVSDPDRKVTKSHTKKDGGFFDSGHLGYGMRAYRKWVYDVVGGYPLDYFPCNDFALCCMIESFTGGIGVRHIKEVLVTVTEDHTGISRQNKELQDEMVVKVSNIARRQEFDLPYELDEDLAAIEAEAERARTTVCVPVTSGPIPHMIHFVWVGPAMPDYAKQIVAMWRKMNPTFVVMVHGEDALLPELRPGYDAITGEHEWSRKSDLLRLSVLDKFGGWYFDCDFVPLRPLGELYELYDGLPGGFFVTQGTPKLIANGIIGTATGNPRFKTLLDKVKSMAAVPENRAWGAFGPELFTKEFGGGSVTVGRMEDFYPIQERIDSLCFWEDLVVDAERTVLEHPNIANSFTVHLSMMDALDTTFAVTAVQEVSESA